MRPRRLFDVAGHPEMDHTAMTDILGMYTYAYEVQDNQRAAPAPLFMTR